MALEVIIVGGGIGGLCLAQGLKKSGVKVTVFEKGRRKVDPHWLQGYQIHINPDAAAALRECLNEAAWDSLEANACKPSDGFQALDAQLKNLILVRAEIMDGSSHLPILRTTLRRTLLDGLDDLIHFDKESVAFDWDEDGRIRVLFADGTTVVGDVLIGADGVGSKVRKLLLPSAQVVDTGLVGTACRIPMGEKTNGLPEHLLTWLTSVLPSRDYMIVTNSVRKSSAEPDSWDVPDHLIWVHIAKRQAYGDQDPRQINGGSLQQLVLRRMVDWHPALRRMVADSDPLQISSVRVLSAIPVRPWPSTNVTLLGDAIHAMTPFLGLGGSTALRDAALLCGKLVDVDQGQAELVPAIRSYEMAMLDYGGRAVRRSAQFGAIISSHSFGRAAFRTALRIANAVPSVKRRIFRPR